MPSIKPRRLESTANRRIRTLLKQVKDLKVSPDEARYVHETFDRYYTDSKSIENHNKRLRDCGLPSIDRLIELVKKPKVNFLDVCAGKGSLGQYFRISKIGKRVAYYPVDILESENVIRHDIVNDILPKNAFDVILAQFGFPYLTDKFKALENVINSLSVNGVLAIPDFGKFNINGLECDLNNTIGRNRLILLLSSACELGGFDFKIKPEGGIIIKKLKDTDFRFNLKFIKAVPARPSKWLQNIESRKVYLNSELVSHYKI